MDIHDPPQLPAIRAFRWVLCGMLIVAGFFLLTEHRAHLLGVLPYLLFAACPLMHLFMHHGHGRHHNGTTAARQPGDPRAPDDAGRSGSGDF